MKKEIAVFAICASVLMTGCSIEELAEKMGNQTPSATAQATPTATPGPVEKKLSLKQKGTIGDWEVTVKKLEVKRKIANGKYRYFQAKKGKTYAVFHTTVKNNGEKADTFVPFVGYANKVVQIKLLDQDQNEYKVTQLMAYDKDLVSETIQASAKKSGVLAFEIPKKAGKNKKKLVLSFEKGDEKLLYSMEK